MKFIERILIVAILALIAAFVINGFRNYPRPSPDSSVLIEKETIAVASEDKPLADFYKTPADDMADPMVEVVFIAKDQLSMMRSLKDLENFLPTEKYEELLAELKKMHKISSGQSESGELELQFPSLLVLKALDGKNAKQILEGAK